MSAVTNIIPFATKLGAEEYLSGLGFVYVKCLNSGLMKVLIGLPLSNCRLASGL